MPKCGEYLVAPFDVLDFIPAFITVQGSFILVKRVDNRCRHRCAHLCQDQFTRHLIPVSGLSVFLEFLEAVCDPFAEVNPSSG